MKTLKFLLPVLLFITLSACKNDKDKEITTLLNTFFKSKNDFRTIDKNLMSKDLTELIKKATEREIADEERIKKSEFPTDKPLCIEGDVFSSLYEGQDSLNIIDIKKGPTTATVNIQFTNTPFKETWIDEVILVNENGWKIDNVIYKGHPSDQKSTKDALLNLINTKY